MVDKLFTKIASLKTNCSKKSVKDTLKGFGDFKNKQQKCMKWCFLMCKSMCILKLYSIYYTLRWNKTLRKISFGQNKLYKKCSFFLSQAPAYHSFTFNLRFLYELKHRVRLSKTLCRIFHYWLHSVIIFLYIFVFRFLCNKMHELFLTLKHQLLSKRK